MSERESEIKGRGWEVLLHSAVTLHQTLEERQNKEPSGETEGANTALFQVFLSERLDGGRRRCGAHTES